MLCGSSLILQHALAKLTMAIQAHRLCIAAMNRMLADEERDEVIFLALVRERQRRRVQQRRWWVKPWLERRRLFGQYHTLFQELEREFDGDYLSYIRMSSNMFAELLLRVGPRITKSHRQVTFDYLF